MLENTNIWTKGPMNLWVNNEPARVYVPDTNVKSTYTTLQSRLSKQGSIPIGIDHLADNIIEANPILKKLDLHNVGEITKISYANDTITIEEAELTNPQIKALYEAGELDMVSIVANSTTSDCPKDYDYIVNTTDITRVDIVEKGACPTCNIPKPQSSDSTVVYARYSIQTKPTEEEEIMAEEITMEAITKAIDKALDEKLAPINERLDVIEDNIEIKEEPKDNSGDESEEVKAMKAEIAELKAQRATARVDMLIAEGKILPAQKEAYVELCASNSEKFEEAFKDAPVIVELDNRQSMQAGDSGAGDDPEPTEDEKLIAEVNDAFNKGE
jgi:hypothetical protein